MYTLAWVAGYLYVGLLSVFRMTWRFFYGLSILPMLLAIVYFFWIPESPHWLAAHNKYCELRKYVDDSVDFNKKEVNLASCAIGSCRKRARKNAVHADSQYKRAFKKPIFVTFILINGYIQYCITIVC